MLPFQDALASYKRGETIDLGPEVRLVGGILTIGSDQFPLNTLHRLALTGLSAVEVRRIGAEEPPLVLEADVVDDPILLVDLVNAIIDQIPYLERRSITGWPPGSVGDLSARLGYDWRDLKMAGYTDAQIRGVLDKTYTLDELFRRKPEGRPR